MKKFASLLLIIIMIFSLASCGGGGTNPFGSQTESAADTSPDTVQTADTEPVEIPLLVKTYGETAVEFYGKDGKAEYAVAGGVRYDLADEPLFNDEAGKMYLTVSESGKKYLVVFSASSVDKTELDLSPAFTSDLSAYEEYMAPADRDGYLLLVNSDHPLEKTFVPADLTNLVDTRSDRAAQQMTKAAAMALEAMYIEMRAAGYRDVSVTSAYRSYDRQDEIFNMYLNMNLANGYDYDTAYAMVASDTALPGQSEHQSGLCCDMHNLGSASQAFANQPVYKWLTENCAKFGFILRYPADKEDVTKIIYEPWHYRFVGRYHAERITALGLALEEYVALLG